MKKNLKLKHIINYLDPISDVVIWQGDTYINPEDHDDPWEEVYRGSVMDIPWYLTNYYLANTKDGEAISARIIEDFTSALVISVVEDKRNVGLL